ncbi:MAG: helix-turn-helix transcriptional regulator [Solibacillus sp.]|uniref:helix-turn-helix domain-containing protein n=1 Tax=unclassified Solibacillus TaxID=2637870 RepID=UPI00310138F3
MEDDRYGRRIRAFRKLKRIQQTELAKRISISVTILGRIERGEKQPTDEQLQSIADVFDINIQELKGNE